MSGRAGSVLDGFEKQLDGVVGQGYFVAVIHTPREKNPNSVL
jgi:hypothetical protein